MVGGSKELFHNTYYSGFVHQLSVYFNLFQSRDLDVRFSFGPNCIYLVGFSSGRIRGFQWSKL